MKTAVPDYVGLIPLGYPNLVTMTTAHGRTLELYVELPKGHPSAPMNKEELVVKFAALASPELTRERVEEVYDVIDRFDELDDMRPFFDAIRIK